MPTLFQFTDTHLMADTKGSLKGVVTRQSLIDCVARARVKQNESTKACHILLTGDLSHDGSQQSYTALQQIISSLNLPVSAIPGNHDDVESMRKSLPADWLSAACLLDHWHVVLLNSALTGEEHGYITPQELEQAKTLVSQSPKNNILLCLHHPPVPVGSQWLDNIMLENPQPLLQFAGAHDKIKGILFGHVHQEFRSSIEGLDMIGSPSTCVQFQSRSDEFALEHKAPAFRILHLQDNGKIETETVYLDDIPAHKPDEVY